MDNLFSIVNKSGKRGVMAALSQAASEASEEAISEVANNLVDIAVMGLDSEFMEYVSSLVQSGMSRSQAEAMAFKQFFLANTMWAAVGGALSGGIIGTGAVGYSDSWGGGGKQALVPGVAADAGQKETASKVEAGNAPYTVKWDILGNVYVEINVDILNGVPESEWKSTVRGVIQKIFGNGIQLPKGTIFSNRKGRGEYSNGSYTRMLERTDSEMYADKLRMAVGSDGIVSNASNVKYEEANHDRTDDIVGFNRGNIIVSVRGGGYQGDVLTAIYSDGKETFFDINNLTRRKIEATPPERYTEKDGFTQTGNVAPVSTIPQATPRVKQRAAAARTRLAVRQARGGLSADTARWVEDLRAQGELEKADELLELSQRYLSRLADIEGWAEEFGVSSARFGERFQRWREESALAVERYRPDGEQGLALLAGEKELAAWGEALLREGIVPSGELLAAMGLTEGQARSAGAMYNAGTGPVDAMGRALRSGGNRDTMWAENLERGESSDTGDVLVTGSRFGAPELTEAEETALLAYKSSESYKINAKLRDGATLDAAEQRMVAGLDRALEKLPKVEGTVYRTLTFDDVFNPREEFEAFVALHTEGMPVRYNAYTSASTEPDGYPISDGARYGVIMEITSKNARDLAGIGNNFESEVLFPRRADFIVRAVSEGDNGYTHIKIEEDIEDGEAIYPKERSRAVRNVQEAHSVHADLRSVSETDSRGDSERG